MPDSDPLEPLRKKVIYATQHINSPGSSLCAFLSAYGLSTALRMKANGNTQLFGIKTTPGQDTFDLLEDDTSRSHVSVHNFELMMLKGARK